MKLSLLDRYLLVRTLRPTFAVLGCTVLAFLMERILISSYLFSQAKGGFGLLSRMLVNLTPHYIGLTLPAGFFIAVFILVNQLSRDSEIDAILAIGISLGRFAAPLVGLGVALMMASLLLYGFLQPLSWYGYHAVLNAAKNAGWSGEVQPLAVMSPTPGLILTADDVDRTGQKLSRIFLSRVDAGGRGVVVTAASGEVSASPDGHSINLKLSQGQQLITTAKGETYVLSFNFLSVPLPLESAGLLFRARGADVAELTLVELFRQGFGLEHTAFLRQGLLAQLYARLARAFALPFMPLLAIPLGLAAKRAGAVPAIAFAALLLFGFQTLLIFGDGLAAAGRVSAIVAEGLPMAGFTFICVWTFMVSRKRPGDNPVSWVSEQLADAITALTRRKNRTPAMLEPI